MRTIVINSIKKEIFLVNFFTREFTYPSFSWPVCHAPREAAQIGEVNQFDHVLQVAENNLGRLERSKKNKERVRS